MSALEAVSRREHAPSGERARPEQRTVGQGEQGLVRNFERIFRNAGKSSAIIHGIGDDAAVLETRGKRRLVWSIDASLEGVHFERQWLDLGLVGYRSMMAAASDLAAMGATPLAALSSLELPRGFAERDALQLARGQARAARQLQFTVVGGNVTRASKLGVHTSVLGEAKTPRLRRGAAAGQQVWLVGEVGLARAGLELLQRGLQDSDVRGVRRCLEAWRQPRALIERGVALARAASAQIDVSDGLALDAGRLGTQSGVRVVLEERLLRACLKPALRATAELLEVDALQLALQGGEDYCLLAIGPERARPPFARPIGATSKGKGVVLVRESGAVERLSAYGHDHLLAP